MNSALKEALFYGGLVFILGLILTFLSGCKTNKEPISDWPKNYQINDKGEKRYYEWAK